MGEREASSFVFVAGGDGFYAFWLMKESDMVKQMLTANFPCTSADKLRCNSKTNQPHDDGAYNKEQPDPNQSSTLVFFVATRIYKQNKNHDSKMSLLGSVELPGPFTKKMPFASKFFLPQVLQIQC